jgi:glycosyltransferase involved in cell wall biosynthesis
MDKAPIINDALTIVIPTIGRTSLLSTLQSINKSSMLPGEVIVSLPPIMKLDRINPKEFFFKVIVINSDKKTQVKQRLDGIKKATSEYILQMDDDIELKKDCIERLYESCKKYPHKTAISPIILERNTLLSFFEYNNFYFNEYNSLCSPNSFSRRFFNFVVHGKTNFRPGEVTQLGTNIQAFHNSQRYIRVNWLHGMLIQHKDNFLNFEHLHYQGKAYSEDCIFSYHLQEKGIALYVDSNAKIIAGIDEAQAIRTYSDLRQFIKEKYLQIRNKAYFCYISKRRYKLFIILSLIQFMFFVVSRLVNKIAHKLQKIMS